MLHLARELGDRDGRGVRADHVARADQLVEFLDQRHLEIEDLRDRLDHDVRARDVFRIRGEGEGGIEELGQIADDNGHARDRGHLGNARSHEAPTCHGDRVDFSRHGCTPPPDRPDLRRVKSTLNIPLRAWLIFSSTVTFFTVMLRCPCRWP